MITYTLPVSATAIPVGGNWGSFPQPKAPISPALLAAAVSFDSSKPKTSLNVVK